MTVVGVVASATGGVEQLREHLIKPLITRGHQPAITLTPTAAEWFQLAREAMYAAGTPPFEQAQKSGDARSDVNFDDVLRMVSGLTAAGYVDDAQRDRVLAIALDGIRTR